MRPGHIGSLLAVLLLLGADGSRAQSPGGDANFAWIELTAGALGVRDVQGYGGWAPEPGPFVVVSSPFYGGRAELGASGRFWSSDRLELPSFTAIFGAAGWSLDVPLATRFAILTGVRAGNYLMIFRTDQLVGQRVESEFAVEPHVGLRIGLTPGAAEKLSLRLEGALLRVFTSPRLDDMTFRAGISWRFETPSGLREFLR